MTAATDNGVSSSGLTRVASQNLKEIRVGIASLETVEERLNYAFEIWTVRPFQLIQTSLDARYLLGSRYILAEDRNPVARVGFEAILTTVLEPMTSVPPPTGLPASRIAYLLASSVDGLKAAAQSPAQLRASISELVHLVAGNVLD